MSDVKKYILVVDDDKPIAKAYKAGLENAGFDVEIAYDGEEALNMINDKKPDLIILDILMPVKDGEEVLDALEKDNILTLIPVMVVTNSVREADMVKRKDYKVAGYFVKSDMSLEELVEKANSIMSNK